jgi:large subunit ribosomal protein L19e
MVNVTYQRRMAAEILKCGTDRVWIDPDQLDEVSEAVTRGDVRRLICYRVIQVRQKKGVSRGRARMIMAQKAKGRRKGPGSRRGHSNARTPRKRRWIRTIRPIREELRELRADGKLDPTTYRIYYKKARGNMYRSRADLLIRLEAAGVISEGDVSQKESAKDRAKREREERRAKAAAARSRVRQKAADARAARDAMEAEEELEEEAPEEPGDKKTDEAPDEAPEDTPEEAPEEEEATTEEEVD